MGKATIDSVSTIVGTDGVHDSVISGQTLGGTVALHMTVAPAVGDIPTRFAGTVWARDIDVDELARSFGVRDNKVANTGGKGFAQLQFTVDGPGPNRPSPADTLCASGEAEVLDANFWKDPVIGLVGAQHPKPYRRTAGTERRRRRRGLSYLSRRGLTGSGGDEFAQRRHAGGRKNRL